MAKQNKQKQGKVRKLARLTVAEDRAWEFGFGYYIDEGKTERQADKLAWADLQKEFPRLMEFDGCLPDAGQDDDGEPQKAA